MITISRIGEENTNNFGSNIIITKYNNNKDINVYFSEYDWTAEHIQYGHFKNGNIKCPYEPRHYGVGYKGEGLYKMSKNGKNTKVYTTWNTMLERCYDYKLHHRYPTYTDCTVCDEWLNFQNFAQWYEDNYYEIEGEKMNLDKDILVKNNKVYSPDTCVFVPHSINLLFIKRNVDRGDFPIGVCFDKKNNKYKAQCQIKNSVNKNLGRYNTPEEAFQAYKTFKENYIKQIANQYIDLIPQSLYNAMINYEVEYDD